MTTIIWRILQLIVLMIVLSWFTGCAGPVRYVATATPYKQAVRAICVSKDDVLTEGTAQAIEADNRALRAINKSRDECKPR
jgi:hypothetical protein